MRAAVAADRVAAVMLERCTADKYQSEICQKGFAAEILGNRVDVMTDVFLAGAEAGIVVAVLWFAVGAECLAERAHIPLGLHRETFQFWDVVAANGDRHALLVKAAHTPP